jgi:hypothetical protein
MIAPDLFNQQGSPAMSSTALKTSAAAIALITTLQAKRFAIVETIDSFAERRREFAVAAHLGDDAAAEALLEIEAEEATARASLKNLEIVICEVERSRDALAAREAAIIESRKVAELAATVDLLLELSDECDAALDHARELLERREAFKREKALILRRASVGKLPGGPNPIADSILAYFDRQLAGLNGGRSYASISRIADSDSRYYGKQSPRQIERGPHPLSPFERMMQRELSPRSAPIEVRQPQQATRR